jgi:hypothetical protein
MTLPTIIQNALPDSDKSTTPTGGKKRQLEVQDESSAKRPSPTRGLPAINASIHTPWQLRDGEVYAENFVRRINRSQLPACDVCLNYHIRGTCHSNCSRADTHIPATSLSADQQRATTEFIKAARNQFAQQQRDRPRRPN